MGNIRRILIILLIAVVGAFFTACEAMQYHTPARERRRRHVVETDLYHMADDIDWVLGLDRPSTLYDQTLR